MQTPHHAKPFLHHLARIEGQISSLSNNTFFNKSIFETHNQLLSVQSSVISCCNNTFRDYIATQLARAIRFHLQLPGISRSEYEYFRIASRNISSMSVHEILSMLDWLRYS